MRLLSIAAALSVAAFALGPVACAQPEADDPASTDDSTATNDSADEEVKSAVIGESQNGKTVDVALGRSFTIALESNASTGYRWQVASVDRTLGQPYRTWTLPGDASRPGAPGVQKFMWRTKSPLNLVGKHTIKLEYQRPWAETTAPAKTFEVTINITDSAQAKKCGGLIGAVCPAGQYCEFEASQACGMADQQGTCQTPGQFCPEVFSPVCGCDGKDYSNSCFANVAGTSVAHLGTCQTAGVRCGNTTCGAGMVCCNPLANICTLPGQFCIQ